MKILIADDSPIFRHLVEATLVKRGYQTTSVSNGIEALTALQQPDAPPLAILDVTMPGMDGTEVCRRIRQANQTLPTYIILLTANSSKADLVAGLRDGANDYVTKPFDGEELCARVQVGMRLVELQRRLAEHVQVLEVTSAELQHNSETLAQVNAKLVCEVAERARAEEALRENHGLLQAIADGTPDAVFVKDLQGRYLMMNSAGAKFLGKSVEEVIGKDDLELFASETAQQIMEADRKVIATGEIQTFEGVSTAAGRMHTYLATKVPYRDGQRKIIGVIGISRDITARKQAEEILLRHSRQAALGADIGAALTESDELQHILQRCAESIVHRLDVAFARLWTLDKDGATLELQASAGLYTQIDGAHSRVPVGEFKIGLIAQERKPYSTNNVMGDLHVSEQEGEELAAFAGYPLIVEDQLVGVLAMFARAPLADDTLEALASVANMVAQGIERKRAEEALRLSEEKYRSLIANIPDVTWTADQQRRISFVSPNVRLVDGFTAEEICQNPRHWFSRIHQDDLKNVEQAYDSLFARNTTYDVKYRIQRKDGEWIWLHDRAVATYARDGVMYADGVFSDITERRRVEEALRQSEENLRRAQKLESIGQLAAGIAHEINTPMQYLGDNTRFLQDSFNDLASVLGTYSQLLTACQAEAASPELLAEVGTAVATVDVKYLVEEIPKALQQSLEGVERVTKIVQSMKDFAHPGVEKKAADLNKAIESTLTVARNEWKYVADLVTDLDPTLPLVPCLLGEFNQVVLNMVINAAHAISDVVGDDSQEKGTITISTRHNGQWAEVRIADTGAGIPEKIRNRIFDPFFTTKEVGRGTGQGLAISHVVVVEKHGGTIEFETKEGRGTTFIVRLPVQGNNGVVVAQKGVAG